MLPRERTLCRKKNGTIADKQAIASYVDKAFIVQSLDDNFNVRRAERFMVQMQEENINPVLVFNKADLGFDKQKVEEQIRHIARQIPVFFTSIHQPQTILQLRESISAGEMVVFVGSSGVGKSSLVNALCEKSVLLTSDISLSTGKGRHTSTRREMVLMDGSGVLIDTPGVREFGLAIDDPDSLAEVLEISDYAASCHFKDCKHINEPGCAVLEAVSSGVLDRKVYESYLKLRREAWHFSTSEHEKGMIKEGREIAAIHPNMVVKIPMTVEGLKAVKVLSAEGIKTNVTLIFSANQALLAARAGATYVSPFLGRLDDISTRGVDLIREIVEIFDVAGIDTEIIAASVRNPIHVTDCALAGADIATVPYNVIVQMTKHPLTDAGIAKFQADYKAVFGEYTIAAPAKLMLDSLKEFAEMPLTIEVNDQNWEIRLSWKSGSLSIPGASAVSYPAIPALSADCKELTLDVDVLVNGINKTIFATADDELRPVMNGVYISNT